MSTVLRWAKNIENCEEKMHLFSCHLASYFIFFILFFWKKLIVICIGDIDSVQITNRAGKQYVIFFFTSPCYNAMIISNAISCLGPQCPCYIGDAVYHFLKIYLHIFFSVTKLSFFFRHIKVHPTSMAETSLRPWESVLEIGSLSHWGLIIMPSQEANKSNLGRSFALL